MHYVRIYADADGESHFEEVAIPLSPRPGGAENSDIYPATGVSFHRAQVGRVVDWHPAPARQFVVTIAGEVEVEVSDGEVRRFGPGLIALAEDLTGKGHITRFVGDGEWVFVFIPTPEYIPSY